MPRRPGSSSPGFAGKHIINDKGVKLQEYRLGDPQKDLIVRVCDEIEGVAPRRVPEHACTERLAQPGTIGQRVGGMDQLKGLKIAHVYIDTDLGWETLPILDRQAVQYGFTVQHLAVKPPGLDQKATWLRVKVAQPDWVILRGWGVMNPTALKMV